MRGFRPGGWPIAAALLATTAFAGLAGAGGERLAVGADLGLGQLAGQEGCVSQVDPRAEDNDYVVKGCRAGRGILGAAAVLTTSDGANVYVAAAESSAVDSFSRDAATGRIVQTTCTSQNGTNGVDGTAKACVDGDALRGSRALAISPDGRHVYSAAWGSDGMGIFTRDGATGRLAQTGCVRGVRTCVAASGLAGASGVAVSPDGKNVYLASADADAVVMFARNPETGALKGLGCISDDGTDRVCGKGNALRGAQDVVVSADGLNVYVAASYSDSVLTFARDPATGLLKQTACLMDDAPKGGTCTKANALGGVSSIEPAPDGRTLFATAYESNALSVLVRDGGGVLRQAGCVSSVSEYDENDNGKIDPAEQVRDGCTHVDALPYPSASAVSPDGGRLYVATEAGVTVFDRSAKTGGLTAAGCITSPSPYGDEDEEDVSRKPACVVARGVLGATDVAVSSDGRNVYVTSAYYNDVVVLGPAVSTAARALAGRNALAVRVSCPAAHVTPCRGQLALTRATPTRSVTKPRAYAVSAGTAREYVLPLRKAELRTRRQRIVAVLAAADADRTTDPSRRQIVLRGVHVQPKPRRR